MFSFHLYQPWNKHTTNFSISTPTKLEHVASQHPKLAGELEQQTTAAGKQVLSLFVFRLNTFSSCFTIKAFKKNKQMASDSSEATASSVELQWLKLARPLVWIYLQTIFSFVCFIVMFSHGKPIQSRASSHQGLENNGLLPIYAALINRQ